MMCYFLHRKNFYTKNIYEHQIKDIINDGYQSTTRETIEFEQALGSDISEVQQTDSAINIEDNLNIYQHSDNDHITENQLEVSIPYAYVTEGPECNEDISKMKTKEHFQKIII